MGGSSKKVTVGYKYHLGLHFVLCHGTADNISRITVDKRSAWVGNNSGGRITIDSPELFGGETREGGVTGAVDFLPGGATQAQNDYLQARLGSDIPAFRGVVSAVLRQVYIGLNPYVKNWAFRVQRIFKRSDGSAQWYESKAQIGNQTTVDNTAWARILDVQPINFEFTGTAHITDVADGVISMQFVSQIGILPALTDEGAFVNPEHDNVHPRYTAEHKFDAFSGTYIGTETNQPIEKYSQVNLGGLSYECIGRMANGLFIWGRSDTPASGPTIVIGNSSTGLPDRTSRIDQELPPSRYLYGCLLDRKSLRILAITADKPSSPTDTTWHEIDIYGNVLDTGPVLPGVFDRENYGMGDSPLFHYGFGVWDSKLRTAASALSAGSGFVRFREINEDGEMEEKSNLALTKNDGRFGSIYLNDGKCYVLTGRKSFPENNESDLNVFETDVVITPGQADMNPAHIIRECLVDRDWGMGYDEADIDDAAFAAAADTLYAETMGISLVWDRQSTIEAFIETILRHIDAALYVDRRTGKFVLKLIRNDYTVGALLTLDESNIERVEGLGRPAFGELINSVTVAYWDAETGNDAAVTVDDTALVQMQGSVINTTVQYPGFTSRGLASRVAQRDLRTLSQPLLSCTIYANREASDLDIGDPFVLTWPDADVAGVVMRVTALALGDGRNNRVRISCTQDAFSLPSQAVILPPADEWVSPIEAPLPAVHRRVQEAPYYELVQLIGQLDADTRIAANPEAGWLMVSAARPQGSAINAVISIDSGAGFEQSATLDFAPWAQLVTAINRTATSITVEDAIDLASVTVGTHAQIDDELVRIDAVNIESGVITIGRGVLDTVPAQHAAGAGVMFWDAFAASDEIEYVNAETVSVKVLTTTGAGLLSTDAAPTDVATMSRRASRPYAPGNLRIGGVLMPETIGVAAPLGLIEWSHRDRKQQTSGALADTTAGDIGPEAGTTYTLRIYDETDALGFELVGIAGTSHTYTDTDELADMPQDDGMGGSRLNTQLRVELFAVRDGLESWQKHSLTITRA